MSQPAAAQLNPAPTNQPPTPTAPKNRRWPWIASIAAAFLLGIAVGTSGQPTPNTPPPTTQAPSAPAPAMASLPKVPPAPPQPTGPADSINQDGTYVIGTDLQPGTYRTSADGECYWARLSSTANESDIIANHLASGPTTVTISKNDAAFLTRDCGSWTKVH